MDGERDEERSPGAMVRDDEKGVEKDDEDES